MPDFGEDNLIKSETRVRVQTEEEIILQPFTYIRSILDSSPIYMKLIEAFGNWLNVEQIVQTRVLRIVEKLHCATLLLEDIENERQLRRGHPTAHEKFGIALTINTANYLYTKVLHESNSLAHDKGAKVMIKQLLNMHRGRGMKIFWRESSTCPNEEEYKDAVIKEGKAFLLMSIRLFQLFSQNQKDFGNLASNLEQYLQLWEDYAEFLPSEYPENDNFADIVSSSQANFTLPIIHVFHSLSEDERVELAIRKQNTNLCVRKYLSALMEEKGSLGYTKAFLDLLEMKIRREIENLGGNVVMMNVFEDIKHLLI